MRTFLILGFVAVLGIAAYVWNSQQDFIDEFLFEIETAESTNKVIGSDAYKPSKLPFSEQPKTPLTVEERQLYEKKVEIAELDAKAVMKEYDENLANAEKRNELENELSKVFSDNEYKESVKKIALEALREANASADNESQ